MRPSGHRDSGRPAGEIASVFASTDVDAENTHQICLALNEAEPNLSPTRFHNSVQNAVSGYWTILTGSRAPTSMVMGGDEILALGLLEAMSQAAASARPVLLVVFDVPMPAPLFATHPIDGGGRAGAGAGFRSRSRPEDAGAAGAGRDGGRIEEPAAAAARRPAGVARVHPVGEALPMLARLARCGCRDCGNPADAAGASDDIGRSAIEAGPLPFAADNRLTAEEAGADANERSGRSLRWHHDVVVMGGGLAGLTLALQLKRRLPALDILILERRVPPGAGRRPTRSASRPWRSAPTISARSSGSRHT